MKKILAIFIALTTVTTLSGCSKKQPRLPIGEIGCCGRLDDRGAIIYKGSKDAETFLVGLDGKNINASEIRYLKDKNCEPTNILDENNFGHAECVGFAYAFKPGVYFDGERDPEKFKDGIFIGEKNEKSSEFFRVNAGDMFGDLTVNSAQCVFSRVPGEDIKYEGSEIRLKGEITLRGRLNIPSRDPKYPTVVFDMRFQGDSGNALPLSAEFYCNSGSEYSHAPKGNWNIYTDVPGIYLGSYPDYSIDFDGLSEGDVNAEVEITITDIMILYGIQGYLGEPTARLLSVKRL